MLTSCSDISDSGNNVFLHEWSYWNAEIVACYITRTLICSLFVSTHMSCDFLKNSDILSPAPPHVPNSSSNITESGNNVFLHEQSYWNAEIIVWNVPRNHNLFTFLHFTARFLKIFRYFVPNFTPVCLTHLQTSLSYETMYLFMNDPAGMQNNWLAISPKPITC